MIFARSNRSAVVAAIALLVAALALAGASAVLLDLKEAALAVVAGLLGIVALAFLARVVRALRTQPSGRLGFFQDRLVLVQGRTELQALWERVEVASLADQTDWALSRWPEVRLTERLTMRLRGGPSFSFRPEGFGVEASACRDLVLRLRDEPSLRDRLPEFDSALDLVRRPVSRGDLIKQLI